MNGNRSKRVPEPLRIGLSDLFRATLDVGCGNEGFIGLSPDGSRYHVVVPVDRQIARGIKACNLPADGTPFGGYKGWHYFPCEGYEGTGDPASDRPIRRKKAMENGYLLQKWAAGLGIDVEIYSDID